MKKHFKLIIALLLFFCIFVTSFRPVRAQAIRNAWDDYYNWLVDLNYRKTEYVQQRLKKQYKNVKNFLEIATKIFTGEALDHDGSHGGGGRSRDAADVLNTDPVSNPQPIYKNYDNSVYNPVTENYETITYYYDDNSAENYVYSFETTNNYITYEYNYTYYDIVVSPKENPTDGKFFKVYFELPDGRSSFNLTPQDIDGVIFNYEVVNYERTVTDSDVIAIWHLDGDYLNTVDNSNNTGLWNSNFVDGRFGGCLLRDGSYTYNSTPSLVYKNYNNIYLSTALNSMPTDWTLEFWLWVPDPSTSLWQDSDGYYHRSKPDNGIINSAPSWNCVAVQSDGQVFVNGTPVYYTGFYQVGYNRNSNGWLSKFLSIYQLGNYLNVQFSYTGDSSTSVENGVTIYYDDMASFAIDEVKFTKRLLYNGYYTPRTEPFDLTFAYTVPDINQNYNCIAIQSPTMVNNTQIGGVRSPNPSVGDVFISLYDGRATSVSQYYNGQWNTVSGAVYLNNKWYDLLQYNFNTLMLSPDTDSNNSGTYIFNYYVGSDTYVDISGDDITFTVDTTDADPQSVIKLLSWIPLLFGAVGTILGVLCPFLPAWLTGLIGLCLGAVITLILFVFIRRK